ncbi:Nuclear envelope morphology protein 1 [Mucor velutinosus]|uniref:Nuclear envelope morphology protein 1 n=1 Tax=Mucor velutinosus TaxID=708070 RepID=A0AAN7DBH2_9FUNG|nr:Nuclear envelope morphology protein 1 [Mucor velutinosus]
MLRRQPTSVTLTAEDVEQFKQLLSNLQEQKDQKNLKEMQDETAVEDCDPDDIFMGKSLLLSERKRRREMEARLGLPSEEQQQVEEFSSSNGEPLFKRVHL